MRRSSMTHSAMVSSATERVLEKGALKTGIPRRWAAARSIWLVPTEKQPTAIIRVVAFKTSRVICVRERMPRMRVSASLSIRAWPSSAVASRSTFS